MTSCPIAWYHSTQVFTCSKNQNTRIYMKMRFFNLLCGCKLSSRVPYQFEEAIHKCECVRAAGWRSGSNGGGLKEGVGRGRIIWD